MLRLLAHLYETNPMYNRENEKYKKRAPTKRISSSFHTI